MRSAATMTAAATPTIIQIVRFFFESAAAVDAVVLIAWDGVTADADALDDAMVTAAGGAPATMLDDAAAV